jgi:hypothetical protein
VLAWIKVVVKAPRELEKKAISWDKTFKQTKPAPKTKKVEEKEEKSEQE